MSLFGYTIRFCPYTEKPRKYYKIYHFVTFFHVALFSALVSELSKKLKNELPVYS